MLPTSKKAQARYLVIYDGACPVCRAIAAWLRAHDPHGILLTRPLQTPRLLDSLHISHDDAERSLQVVGPLGQPRLQGADALITAVGALPGYGWLRVIWRIAPLRPVVRLTYRIFAALRPRDKEACPVCESKGRVVF